MKQTYTGGCQCGAVRFEVSADIVEVFSCNCSRCGKLGALLAPASRSDFKLLTGENDVTNFQFNRHLIHHPFCATCGIQSFAHGKGPGGKDMVMINVGVSTTSIRSNSKSGSSTAAACRMAPQKP